jgi:hypothetical protein
MKARQLIQDVMVKIGAVGALETMGAPQAQIGLRDLNRVMDRWQASRLYVFCVGEVVATVGGQSATLGPGLQFDCPAPQALHAGCYYVRSGMSYPLDVWDREGYNAITLKSQANDYPDGVFFDRIGKVFFTGVPSPCEFHLQVLQRLPKFANLDTDYAMADGYEDALYWTLCERLPGSFNLPVDPQAAVEGRNARRVIRKANIQVPTLQIAGSESLQRYNILSNQP